MNELPSSLVRAPRFAAASPFAVELQTAVAEYFRSRNLSVKANGAMMRKSVVLLAWCAASYATVLAPGVPGLVRLVACAALGLGYAGVGMSIGHDALHGAYSHRAWVNRLLGCSFDLMGASSYIWRYTHNIAHHTYTNIDELDPDVDFGAIIRVVSSKKPRPLQRFQWLYAFPVYALSGVRWLLYKDISDFRRRRLGPYVNLRHPWWAWGSLFLGRAAVLALTVAVPLIVLRPAWWQLLVGFLLLHVVTGTTMALVFLLAHIVEGPAMLSPTARRLTDSFFEHQVRTTADFACGNRPLSWFLGGLNYQVEHHLFPQVCSVHYPALRPLVREISARHGLPIWEFPTMRMALRAHVTLLRRMGSDEAEHRVAAAA